MHRVSIIANRVGIPSDSNRAETALAVEMPRVDGQLEVLLHRSTTIDAAG